MHLCICGRQAVGSEGALVYLCLHTAKVLKDDSRNEIYFVQRTKHKIEKINKLSGWDIASRWEPRMADDLKT